jgi:NAD(P)-dependent dehydrogenase (short-subunit alcohol dehydrogenase family)
MIIKETHFLITGAARGIGLSIAQLLHDEGASITIIDIDGTEIENAAKKLELKL